MSDARYPAPTLFIGGAWLSGGGRDFFQVINPATGEALAELPLANAGDLDAALDAADKGFKLWSRVSAYDRAKVLRKAAELIRERADQIATVMVLEEGKPHAEARMEVMGSADQFEWFAEEGRRAYGRIIPARADGVRQMVIKQPVGPVAAFAPWNFPAVTPARKIAALLGAGCSCIIKPAEETPATCLALAKALDDAGLPKGVLNVVFGVPAQVSTHLINAAQIRKVSFTGSTAVGKQLAAMAAQGAKRTTMELGGHAPVVVFEDADIEAAAALSVAAKFRNAGQVCVSPTRFYVHDRVHDDFVARLTSLAEALPVGDGLDPASKMGPLANSRRIDAMTKLIDDAVGHGAKLKTGGERIGNRGYFYKPTVLADVPVEARIMNEEPFGPVAVTSRFSSFDEVVAQANRLPFGLASYSFTRSVKYATAIADALESGMVGVNTFAITVAETPFGGIKESGYGSEGGIEGLDAYLNTKFIAQA
jgi:succinate-semialdehyde dehydrogenase / glutarate-semialdehyde dehydrogenase